MKIYSPVLLVSLAEHLQILKKMCFIYSDMHIIADNTHSEVHWGVERWI